MRSKFGVRRPQRRFAFLLISTLNDPKRRQAAALQIYLILTCTVLPHLAFAQHRTLATITVDTSRPVNRFIPSHALGAAIDGHEKGVNALQLKPNNIKAMLSAGLRPLTYRLRTELGMDVWHWNSNGSWSDETRHEGYWISNNKTGPPISLSYGYSLPRRGNTLDQAANNGYSRIDDGDEQTFWKSNPYLDSHFTGEDNQLHSQWIVIQFAQRQPINAVHVLWGEPFAKHFRIQYGKFDDPSVIALNPPGSWIDFPNNEFEGAANKTGNPQNPVLRLSQKPISTRWIRILLNESSASGRMETDDVRDRVGFAVRELYAGMIDDHGAFRDSIRHGPNREQQTIIRVSSTDPWHRASDRDDEVEQAGLDHIYQTGLTNDLPMLVPTGILYDTPENAANEIRYLRARGYKFNQVELGEEPDGQYITPEDFGALYVQFADAIHRVDPKVQLGGPSFQEILPNSDQIYPIDNATWMRRFLAYLKDRNRLADFAFFSFEWYPFDNVCAATAPQVARAQRMLKESMDALEHRGNVPRNIPWIITEYGYSAFAGRAEISIEGALMHADIVGEFLTLGGDQAFLYGYAPDVVLEEKECSAGNNMLFSMDDDGDIQYRFATYFGARLLTQEWLMPGDKPHDIYPANSDIKDQNGNELVAAYAVRRPDGVWSLLIINKDPKRSFEVNLAFRNGPQGREAKMKLPIDVYQYSEQQYQLSGSVKDPFPIRAEEPRHELIRSFSRLKSLSLPPYSLTVVRGPATD